MRAAKVSPCRAVNFQLSPNMASAPKDLPSFDELPDFHEHSGCAWGVWGQDDQLGTVNLLTDDVVKQAAQEEIRY